MKLCRYLLTISMIVLMMGTSKAILAGDLTKLQADKDRVSKSLKGAEQTLATLQANPGPNAMGIAFQTNQKAKYEKELADIQAKMNALSAPAAAPLTPAELAAVATSFDPLVAPTPGFEPLVESTEGDMPTAATKPAAPSRWKNLLSSAKSAASTAGSYLNPWAYFEGSDQAKEARLKKVLETPNANPELEQLRKYAILDAQVAEMDKASEADKLKAQESVAKFLEAVKGVPAVKPAATPATVTPAEKPAATTMPAPKEREEYLDVEGEVVFYPERQAEPTSGYAAALLGVRDMRPITPSEVKAQIKSSMRNEEEKKLYERFDRETKNAIRGTILADDSLPSANNRRQWAEAFVSAYESPYVMSRLNQAQKQVYADRINAFFANFDYDNMTDEQISNSLSNIEAFYATLSPRLKRELQARVLPYIVDSIKSNVRKSEAADAQFDKQVKKVEQLEKQAQKAADDNDTKKALSLRQEIEKTKEQALATKTEAMNLAKKAAIGLAATAVLGGTAVMIDKVTGGHGQAMLSSIADKAWSNAPSWETVKGVPGSLWGKMSWENAKWAGSSLAAAGKNIVFTTTKSAATGAIIPALMAKAFGGNVKDALKQGALAGAAQGLSAGLATELGGGLAARVGAEMTAQGVKEVVVAYALGESLKKAMLAGAIKGAGISFVRETADYAAKWMPEKTMLGKQGPMIVKQAVSMGLPQIMAQVSSMMATNKEAAMNYAAGVSGLLADKALVKALALRKQGASDKQIMTAVQEESTDLGEFIAGNIKRAAQNVSTETLNVAAGVEPYSTEQFGFDVPTPRELLERATPPSLESGVFDEPVSLEPGAPEFKFKEGIERTSGRMEDVMSL